MKSSTLKIIGICVFVGLGVFLLVWKWWPTKKSDTTPAGGSPQTGIKDSPTLLTDESMMSQKVSKGTVPKQPVLIDNPGIKSDAPIPVTSELPATSTGKETSDVPAIVTSDAPIPVTSELPATSTGKETSDVPAQSSSKPQKSDKPKAKVVINGTKYDVEKITSLTLGRQNLKTLPACIQYFNNLQELDLSFTMLSSLPDWLKNLPKLKKLMLSGNHFDDSGLQCLKDIKTLVYLDLAFNETAKGILPDLKSIPTLAHLYLADCSIYNSELKALAEIPALTDLDLSLNKISDLGVTELAKMSNLVYLNVSKNPGIENIESIQKLANMEKLEELVVGSNTSFNKKSILSLIKSKNEKQSLKKLIIKESVLSKDVKKQILGEVKDKNPDFKLIFE